jgi:hypothetical protein
MLQRYLGGSKECIFFARGLLVWLRVLAWRLSEYECEAMSMRDTCGYGVSVALFD